MFQEMSNDEWISLGGGGQALTRRLLKKFHFIRDGILSKDTEPHINLIVDYESAEGATSPYIDGSHLPMTTARLVNRGNILLPDVSVHSPKVYFSLGSYHLIPSGPYSSLVQPPKYLPFLSLLFIDCDVPHLESGTIRQKLLWAKCDIESRSDKFENSKIPLKGRQHEGAFQLQAEENDPVKYEQPKPQRGTDWHRCLYVLINHENSLNLLLPESSNSNFDLQKILGQNKGAQVIATQWFLTTWTKKVTELYRNENDKEIGFGNIVQMRS